MNVRVLSVILFGLAIPAIGADLDVCPAPRWPDSRPSDPPPVRPYIRLDSFYTDVAEMPLGIGHIRPAEAYFWDWQDKVRLPLYSAPKGEVAGFIDNAWVFQPHLAESQWQPLGTEGLVETAYETPSFLVLESRADGWINFRYAPPLGDLLTGTAWLHECHLLEHAPELRFEPWVDRFLSDEISPLYFRSSVPHVLRASPGIDAEQLGVVAGSHHLEPIEVKGDWMRVIVKQPSDYCMAEGETAALSRTGWVKWYSPDKGPWVWYYTRGC